MFQNEWTPFLKEEFQKPYFQQLSAFLRQQYATTKVYPPRLQVFSAFEFTNYSDVKGRHPGAGSLSSAQPGAWDVFLSAQGRQGAAESR